MSQTINLWGTLMSGAETITTGICKNRSPTFRVEQRPNTAFHSHRQRGGQDNICHKLGSHKSSTHAQLQQKTVRCTSRWSEGNWIVTELTTSNGNLQRTDRQPVFFWGGPGAKKWSADFNVFFYPANPHLQRCAALHCILARFTLAKKLHRYRF